MQCTMYATQRALSRHTTASIMVKQVLVVVTTSYSKDDEVIMMVKQSWHWI